MDWIRDNLQIVVIVLLALGSWLSSRMEAKKNETEEQEYEDDGEVYEPEPQRQPSVPPPLARRMAPPELPVFAEERADEAAAMLKHQQELEERLRQIRETKATTSGGASATRTRLAAKGKAAKPTAPAAQTIRASVRNRKQLRRNIVIREILGKPVGLR